MILRLPTRDEIHRAFLQGEEAIVGLFAELDRLRGYLSTARKNATNVFAAIRDAFAGCPLIPTAPSA